MTEEAMRRALTLFPILLISLCVHEWAHAWVADRRGDPTARLKGRLTLNPMAHIDLFGTVLLPFFCLYNNWFFVGWAKPVPVNPSYLKNGRVDMAWVAAAGPISNIALSLLGVIIWGMGARVADQATLMSASSQAVLTFVQINLMLAFFNLLPVPPLDGSRILNLIVPRKLGALLDRYEGQIGIFFLLLVYLVPGSLGGIAYLVKHSFAFLINLALP